MPSNVLLCHIILFSQSVREKNYVYKRKSSLLECVVDCRVTTQRLFHSTPELTVSTIKLEPLESKWNGYFSKNHINNNQGVSLFSLECDQVEK